jgi:hypothetical protein
MLIQVLFNTVFPYASFQGIVPKPQLSASVLHLRTLACPLSHFSAMVSGGHIWSCPTIELCSCRIIFVPHHRTWAHLSHTVTFRRAPTSQFSAFVSHRRILPWPAITRLFSGTAPAAWMEGLEFESRLALPHQTSTKTFKIGRDTFYAMAWHFQVFQIHSHKNRGLTSQKV